MSQRVLFVAGAKATAPLLLGILPFAVIAGATAVAADLPLLAAHALSFVIFAGASQLATIELLDRGTPIAIVVLTALLINLRMLMYSASIAPHFKNLPSKWKTLIAYLLTDQAFALSIARYEQEISEVGKRWFYLGAAFSLWFFWQLGTAAGIYMGAALPPELSFEFAIPLTFMALLFPLIRNRPSWIAAATAAVVAVLGHGLPFNLGFIAAALSGSVAALLAEGWSHAH